MIGSDDESIRVFRPVPHPRRFRHDDDALRVRRALVLTDAAARAVVFVDVDAVLDRVQEFMCRPPTHNDVTALALVRAAKAQAAGVP